MKQRQRANRNHLVAWREIFLFDFFPFRQTDVRENVSNIWFLDPSPPPDGKRPSLFHHRHPWHREAFLEYGQTETGRLRFAK